MTGPTDPKLAEAIRSAAGQDVPWDDLRQQRVLARIEAQRAAPAPSGFGSGSGSRWTRVAAIAAAAAVLLTVTGLVWSLVARPPAEVPSELVARALDTNDTSAPAAVPLASIPFEASPQLRLPDQSVAQLRNGAQVDVDSHDATVVHLSQHRGEVRYVVTPDRTRDFIVDAGGVQVRVVGTIFTVTIADDDARVTVAVERGLVEVDTGERVTELGPGDALSVDPAEFDDEVIAIEAEPAEAPQPREARPAPSIESLLQAADRARATGDLARAAAALRQLVSHHRHDPRAYSALFQLGKVERARGRHAAAARAFGQCHKRSPRGPLAEDARAEAALAWHAAGRADKARTAAEHYLDRYPKGTHRTRLVPLLAR